ncbi:hypothetical protein L6452_40267 [Arctium lappa]|uniref:Uncharacterized protein n=1 Tax=Arctium lappa TaxID=4217 RepID=A0ACB8XKU9_ARCLA|nr:hypothetical protein L6452_40267 [Arctium lappa]
MMKTSMKSQLQANISRDQKDIDEQIEALKGKDAKLEMKNTKLQEDLERLQRAYLRDGKTLSMLQDENGCLIDKVALVIVGKYISAWALSYQRGPRSSVLWRFHPSKGYEQWLRDVYYSLKKGWGLGTTREREFSFNSYVDSIEACSVTTHKGENPITEEILIERMTHVFQNTLSAMLEAMLENGQKHHEEEEIGEKEEDVVVTLPPKDKQCS